MLYIEFGPARKFMERPDFIMYPSAVFRHIYSDEWFSDPFVKRIIKEVDHLEIEDIYSLYRLRMTPDDLSNGSKNLMMCKFLDRLNALQKMGSNCWPFLMEIADTKDVYMASTNTCYFTDEVIQGRNICFVNLQTTVNNQYDFMHAMFSLKGEFSNEL